MIIDKNKYRLDRANNLLEKFRSDEISRLVRKKYTLGAETRILYNFVKDPNNPEYIAEFEQHEAYVTECKIRVDTEMAALELELKEEFLNEW